MPLGKSIGKLHWKTALENGIAIPVKVMFEIAIRKRR
jgi:hypothetical protein